MDIRRGIAALVLIVGGLACYSGARAANLPLATENMSAGTASMPTSEAPLYRETRTIPLFRLTTEGIGVQTERLSFELDFKDMGPLPKTQIFCVSLRFKTAPSFSSR